MFQRRFICMKYIQSNKGYTLLLTLVLIVILIMITTTFTMASMNQAKQVVKTDETIVATSIAEMGFEKYNIIVNNKFNDALIKYNSCDFSNNAQSCLNNFHNNFTPNFPTEFERVNNNNNIKFKVQEFTRESNTSRVYNLYVIGEYYGNQKVIKAQYLIPEILSFNGNQNIPKLVSNLLFDSSKEFSNKSAINSLSDGQRLRFRPTDLIEGFSHIKNIEDVWIEANELLAYKFFKLKDSKANINKLEFLFPSGSQNGIYNTHLRVSELIFNSTPNSSPHKFDVSSTSKLCVNQLSLKDIQIENNKGNKTEIITITPIATINDFKKYIVVNDASSAVYVKLGSQHYKFSKDYSYQIISNTSFDENCGFIIGTTFSPLNKIEYK